MAGLFRRRAGSAPGRDGDLTVDLRQAEPVPARPEPEDDGLKPSAMRGNEPLYGYAVGVELVVVAILDLVVRGGAGAPAHPQTAMMGVAVAASLAVFGLVQTRNRMVVGFGVIIAAFLVTYPPVPNALQVAHILAIIVPIGYALLITQRQRRIVSRQMKAARSSRTRAAGGGASRDRSGGPGRAGRAPGRRRGGPPDRSSGPRPSARYTPPKAKRGRR